MIKIKLVIIFAFLVPGIIFSLKNPFSIQIEAQKKDVFANWLPNHEIQGVKFVGSETCNSCHLTESHTHSSMANALIKPGNSQFLNDFPAAKFQNGDYTYKLRTEGANLIYTVSDGTREISEPVLFIFGEGRVAQVFVFRHDGVIYESRVSYYRTIKNLDFTVAQTKDKPTSLEGAIGRIIPDNEVQNCFSCHSTGAVQNRKLQIDNFELGVNCEACHGPGGNHIAAVKDKDSKDLQIFNPAKLSPLDLSQEFCGSCHVGFDKVLEMPNGIVTARFQPYRLFNSPGHDSNDARLSCTACHSPHERIAEEPKSYDVKCTACHVTTGQTIKQAGQTAPACPVKSENCVTCHMPRTEVPDMHFKFTDHWIRVVRSDEKIPQ